MIPPIVKDFINKVTDEKMHPEKRQYFYQSLLDMRKEIDNGLKIYEIERNFDKKKEKQ